jgi:hypothetical protein
MHKFPITGYKIFSELPLDEFNTLKFSVYIIDFNWNYLFVNDFVKKNLGKRADGIVGKNMWEEFKELAHDSAFRSLKANMDRRIPSNFITTSPLTGQRLNVVGYPLDDCFFFSSSILPDKDVLIAELRDVLPKSH